MELGGSDYLGQFALAVKLTAQGAGIRQLELSDYLAQVPGDYFVRRREERKRPDQRRKFQLVQEGVGAPGFVVARIEAMDVDNKTRHVIERLQQSCGGGAAVERPLADAVWTLEGRPCENEAGFKLEILKDGEAFLTLHKTVRLHRRSAGGWNERFGDGLPFAVEVELRAEDHTRRLLSVAFTLRGPEGLVREDTRVEDRMAIGGFADPERRAELRNGDQAGKADKCEFPGGLDWAGMVNKYFALVAVADPRDPLTRFEKARAYPAYSEGKATIPGVLMSSYQVKFDEGSRAAVVGYRLFAGPKDLSLIHI